MLTNAYEIRFFNERVEEGVAALPKTLIARFYALVDRMEQYGPNLGEPHTQSMGNGLYEMRLKGAEGIARVFLLRDRREAYRHASLFCEEDAKDATEGTGNGTPSTEGGS
ncbi:bacteriophage protein [Burkholderia lata]|nr:bacteriophage protein [Burkholderia lata]